MLVSTKHQAPRPGHDGRQGHVQGPGPGPRPREATCAGQRGQGNTRPVSAHICPQARHWHKVRSTPYSIQASAAASPASASASASALLPLCPAFSGPGSFSVRLAAVPPPPATPHLSPPLLPVDLLNTTPLQPAAAILYPRSHPSSSTCTTTHLQHHHHHHHLHGLAPTPGHGPSDHLFLVRSAERSRLSRIPSISLSVARASGNRLRSWSTRRLLESRSSHRRRLLRLQLASRRKPVVAVPVASEDDERRVWHLLLVNPSVCFAHPRPSPSLSHTRALAPAIQR